MEKEIQLRHFKICLLFWAMILTFLFIPQVTSAKSSDFVAASSSGYTSVGKAKIKLSYTSGKVKIYFKKAGKTYNLTCSSNSVSAITDGSVVYYNENSSNKLYKWTPLEGTTEKVGSIKKSSYGSYLVGGSGNTLYFMCNTNPLDAEADLYSYSLKTKKYSRIKKAVFYIGLYGKKLVYEGFHGDPSPVSLYVYNTSTKKQKKITGKQVGGTVDGKWLYYADVTKTTNGYQYIVRVKRYNLSNGKSKTLASNVQMDICLPTITGKYMILWKDGAQYKYTYSTKKYKKM